MKQYDCRLLERLLLVFAVFAAIAAMVGCGGKPGGSSALSTSYTVNAPAGSTVSIDFGMDTNYGLQTSSQPAPSGGGNLTFIVAGMRPNTKYHMRARAVLSNGETAFDSDRTYTTGRLNGDNFPKFTVSGDTRSGRGIELINLAGTQGQPAGPTPQLIATDLAGNIIWYYDHDASEGWVFGFTPIPNGNFLLVLSDYAAQSTLREVDLSGATVRELSLSALNEALQTEGSDIVIKFLHHDILQLPNGHIVLLGAQDKTINDLVGQLANTAVEGDVVVDLDPNLKPVWTWSTFDHLDLNRHPLSFPPDWTHANTLVYTADHNLLLSLRNQNWILKLNYRDGAGNGNILWKLGNEGDFTLTNGNISEWQYAQHYPHILFENGDIVRLAVWDNGNGRIGSNGVACTNDCYSRAVIFDLNQQTMTATLVWQDKLDFYTPWGGSISQMNNGNVEFDLPAATTLNESRVIEVTQTPTPQTIWEMNISVAQAYRAFRVPSLYPGVQW